MWRGRHALRRPAFSPSPVGMLALGGKVQCPQPSPATDGAPKQNGTRAMNASA